jgi:hypothetical protein
MEYTILKTEMDSVTLLSDNSSIHIFSTGWADMYHVVTEFGDLMSSNHCMVNSNFIMEEYNIDIRRYAR